MKNSIWLLISLAIIIGCTPFHGKIPGEIVLDPPKDYKVVGEFEIDAHRFWTLYVVPLKHENIRLALLQEIDKFNGDGIMDLEYESQKDGLDIFLGISLAGLTTISYTSDVPFIFPFNILLQSRSLMLRGKVIKFNEKKTENK